MILADALAGLGAYVNDPTLLVALLLAVPLGVLAGVIPGLGGKLSIVMAIPFLVGADPTVGAVFLLAMHSVIHTGGPIPSILLGVPGSGPDAATVVDGHPMARNGQAGRALGAALASSCVGGIFGALVLALALPLVKPVLLSFGPPEVFMLAVLGITFIAAVSGARLARGLMVGCIGLLVSFVGMDPIGGVARYTAGQLFLMDGVDLITAVVGLFAIPEMLALMRQQAHHGALPRGGFEERGILDGMLDVWRHRYLTLRASLIGTVIGIIPGLGGDVASWVSYGHAVQSSPRPGEFGKGRVEGVIAPEAANNSKEGGSLLPTLFFGIPGSSGMAVLLGAFVTLGITPGPSMAGQGLTLVWTLIWALVLANVLAVAVFLPSAGLLARVAGVSGAAMFPFVLCFALIGTYLSALHWQTFIVLSGFGLLGVALKHHEWPRGPFAIGLVLGTPAEIALHQSLAIWGASFLLRPLTLVLIALVLASLWQSLRRYRRSGEEHAPDRGLLAVFAAVFGLALVMALRYPAPSSVLPALIAGLGALLALACGVAMLRNRPLSLAPDSAVGWRSHLPALAWLALFVVAVLALGLSPGLPLALLAFHLVARRSGLLRALLAGATMLVIVEGVFAGILGVSIYRGLIGG
ncbi:MAG: tripartite tricarboxylate transporter permease [Gammaproteobacteria bacterium]|nr:tripartite tricarboxylate transporter permease [Gammaproteobacteria bacterium]